MSRQKNKIPGSFSTKILKRFMDEKELTSLYHRYKEACYRVHRMREVTALDRKIAADNKAGLMLGELCEKYRKSRSFVLYSIAIVAREN
jgi:hypothetical protein